MGTDSHRDDKTPLGEALEFAERWKGVHTDESYGPQGKIMGTLSRELLALHAQLSETRRTYEDGLEEAKNAVKRVTSAGRWDCGYEEPFDDAVQVCISAIRALKKADTQGEVQPSGNTSREAGPKVGSDPAASAPCVAPAPIPTEDVLWEIRQELAALVSDPNNPDWMPALKNGNPADAECLNRAYELTGRGSESSAPCVARRAVEEIKAIIQKHVPLPGWAYEDEIVRVVRECERPGE